MPRQLDIDPRELERDDPAARALATGRLVATVVSGRTGAHVTVQARAKAKVNGRWRLASFAEATHVFLDTPTPDGPGSRIGTYYPAGKQAGKLWVDTSEGIDREWAADYVLRWAAGRAVNGDATVLLGTECLACGRELTDPVSIETSIGPECRKRLGMNGDGGRHHVSGEQFAEEERDAARAPDLEIVDEVAHWRELRSPEALAPLTSALSDSPASSGPQTPDPTGTPSPEAGAREAGASEPTEGSAPDGLFVLRPGERASDVLRREESQ